MSRNATLPVFAAAYATLLVIIAFAAPRDVEFDNPMRPLDAAYHDVPAWLIADLRTNPPSRPYGFLSSYCYPKCHHQFRGVEYCICFGEQGCRDLIASRQCGAKIGELKPGIGICRMRPNDERVTVTG